LTLSQSQREFVRKRANGCCEYCRAPEDSDVLPYHADHIRPRKLHGSDEPENLCFSCNECNAHKGTNVGGYDPVTDEFTMLYNPRSEDWEIHFRLEENAAISGLTAIGRTTVDVLNINEVKRVKRRQYLVEAGEYPCQTEE
jgi:hypothetical protein